MSTTVERLKERHLLGNRIRFCRRVMKDRVSVYHVMSRTVRGNFWFDDRAKEIFRKMVWKQAAFTGVEVLSFCVMSNHFHLLLRVPECPLKEEGEHLVDDEEILRRYEAYYGRERPRSTFSVDELRAAFAEGGETAEFARQTVLARMGDLGAFMKELKQRFVFWFNKSHETVGTLWSETYKSVLVENRVPVISQVAAYIDLNPVRAGIINDPSAYRWSLYGEAMRGSERARGALAALMGTPGEDLEGALRAYRLVLYGLGGGPKGRKSPDAGRIDVATVDRVVADGGKVPLATALRCRLREFTESIALGSDEFLAECQARFSGGRMRLRKTLWNGWKRVQAKIAEGTTPPENQ